MNSGQPQKDQPAVESVGSRVNFAVIGCGMLAFNTHIPHLAHSPRTVLHTCCDLSEDALKRCREGFGARKTTRDFVEAIRDPEVHAICLATTEKLRLPAIAEAARAGKPIYVEKPLARSLEEAYEIQRVVKQARIPFCLGHNRRSAPAMIDAHRIFRRHMTSPRTCSWRFDREGKKRPALQEDGVAAMSVRINDDWYSWKAWVFDKEQAPHGPLLFEMTHFTDMCNWFLAARPESVFAMENGMLSHSVVIRYATGEIATIMMTANGTFGYPKELYEIFGNGGAVIVNHMLEIRTAGIADAPEQTVYPLINDRYPYVGRELGLSGWLQKRRAACRDASATGDTSLTLSPEADKGWAHALDHFVDEIRGHGPPVCGIDDAVLATRVAFAAVRSSREHRVVNVEEV